MHNIFNTNIRLTFVRYCFYMNIYISFSLYRNHWIFIYLNTFHILFSYENILVIISLNPNLFKSMTLSHSDLVTWKCWWQWCLNWPILVPNWLLWWAYSKAVSQQAWGGGGRFNQVPGELLHNISHFKFHISCFIFNSNHRPQWTAPSPAWAQLGRLQGISAPNLGQSSAHNCTLVCKSGTTIFAIICKFKKQ